ncbi:E3 ubiquitin-protein ligase RING1-like [Apostasia shenzhenica]|uniref:E3 ubiquitin-protein ligase RING1-like n=1 Tax=Apostasia shenzhenica TaxID=1088818 RepID=A0A2H9ZX84_9ASPA|nr:E3 ubiquitin-protein ligase RING1-like [Apostasia shenzhenica]
MMLPGVELARRRRLYHRYDLNGRGPADKSSSRPPSSGLAPQPIEEPAAAAARRRLEEKLRRPISGSASSLSSPSPIPSFHRWMRNSAASIQESSREGHESSAIPRLRSAAADTAGSGGGRPARRESMADVCSVCLAEFRERQQVIWLPCAHRYHSGCVLPWLAAHSHCPYCRAEVLSLELTPE